MSRATAFLLLGGGTLVTAAGVWFGKKKMDEVTDAIEEGVNAPPVPLPPSASIPQEISNKLPTVNIHTTGYWPYVEGLSQKERLMEGGTTGAAVWRGVKAIDPNTGKRPIIYTLEQHLSDPIRYPYVSISGDPNVWPFGQRLILNPWPNAIMRVTDTGGHFTGLKKTYRVMGEEPLDVAVNGPQTVVPKKNVVARIVPGDTFVKKGSAELITSNLKNQIVKFTGELKEGRTQDDYEALARALESELGGRSHDEMTAAAWTIRNRADVLGCSVKQMLAPRGYGTTQVSGGYASTRKQATAMAKEIAETILGADQMYDITAGATDFWVPSQQAKMHQFGDVYRAAKKNGDIAKAVKYSKYAKYGSEGDVRVGYAKKGLRPVFVVGALECLKKI